VVRPRGTATAVILSSVIVLCSACGPGSDPAPVAAEKPVSGGTLTYAVDSEPSCLDPHVSPADITALIGRGIFDSLVAQDADGKLNPWLAKSWQVSPDVKSYVFELRTDVKFHDGTPFNAAAVKANFDRIANPATKSQYAASMLGPYAGTTVVDDDTVKVDFSKPFAPFLQAASTTYLGMQSPKALTEAAKTLCDKLVGSGPFIQGTRVPQQSVDMRRNPDYNWAPPGAKHTGPAYLDQVVIKIIPEEATRLGALRSGQVDGIAAVAPANAGDVKADQSLQLISTPIRGATYNLSLNTSRAPFDDVRVRRALQRGIDIDAIVRTVYFGQFERAWSLLTPNSAHYNGDKTDQTHDQAAAGRLLDEAGWTARDEAGYRVKDGKRLTAQWPYSQKAATVMSRGTLGEAIQAEAKKIGIDIQRVNVQPAQLFAASEKGDYDVFDTSWTRAEPDIMRGFLASDQLPLRGQNSARLKDTAVDAMLNTAVSTTDDKVRGENYVKVQQWNAKEAVVVPIFVPTYLLGAKAAVRGLTSDPVAFPLFYDAWLAK
jgi:peptide/nickel transport system substrate-binding protein